MEKQKTPTQAVRLFCVQCVGGIKSQIKDCGGNKPIMCGDYPNCPLYKHRMGRGRISVSTIRKHCMICMGGSYLGVRECPSTKCPLYKFRMGTNSNYGKDRELKSKLAKKQGLSKIGLESRAKKKVKK